MRVLVTGGAGFIGTHVCQDLLRRGHAVDVLDDLSTGCRDNLAGLPVGLYLGTVADPDVVAAASRKVDAVVHLAAVASVPDSFERPADTLRVNAVGTHNVLEAARATGAHVVVASSASIYGDDAAARKHESAEPLPSSPYAVSKLVAELYATAWQRAFGLPTLTFRFFNVFGPLQRPSPSAGAVVPAFITAALAGAELSVLGDGRQVRDFVPVTTAAAVIAEAVERRLVHPAPVNLALGGSTSLLDLIAHLEEILGRRLPTRHLPARQGDIRSSCADDSLFRRLFPGVATPSITDTLRDTVAWWQSGNREIASAVADEKPNGISAGPSRTPNDIRAKRPIGKTTTTLVPSARPTV